MAKFLTIILSLSFVINFYVLFRLFGLFALKRKILFGILVVICTFSFILGIRFHSSAGTLFSKIVYITTNTWLGFLWLLFSTLLIYEIVRFFIKVRPAAAGTGILIIAGLATLYALINAQILRVKTLTFDANVDCNIVQISDVHLGCVSEKFFKKVIEKTNELNPDIVLITGDLLEDFIPNTRKDLQALKDLKGTVLFVTGNHERYSKAGGLTEYLTSLNVKVIHDQLLNCSKVQIIGIDDDTDEMILGGLFAGMNIEESKFCILMSHRPVDLQILSRAKIDLTLAGHTHAGQIFPFNFVVRTHYKYMYGLYKHNNSYLYVTSGAGTWGPRMRLGSPSEIVLVKLRKIAE
ncbi:MAG: metallophosphoesterase [Sedimentisphaerales bacterium]|nr:metallophosphoesterase [Sedimentisphaerales bacterium]